MTVNEHPIVYLVGKGDRYISTPYGYLFIVAGVPWVARTLEDAKASVPAVPIPLEPRLLVEQRDGATDEQMFLYRGEWRSSDDIKFS